MILDMSPPNGSGSFSLISSFIIPVPAISGFNSAISLLSTIYFFGKTTDSLVICLIFEVNCSILVSDFFRALFSFSLMNMWFSLETFKFAFSFLRVLKSFLDFYSFSSTHWMLCSSFLMYSSWSKGSYSFIVVETVLLFSAIDQRPALF